MSDFDTMYFAGLAGARGDHAEENRQIAEHNLDSARKWRNYARELEHLLKSWQDKSVDLAAKGFTKDQLIERTPGQTVYDLAGSREAYERMVEDNKPRMRKELLGN